MTPRHHLKHPEMILRTSFFHHFSWSGQIGPVSQGFPLSHGDGRHTIVKLIKNDYDRCLDFFIWLTCGRDITGQRVTGKPWWRNPLWPPEGAPGFETWRRLLRTTNMPFTEDQSLTYYLVTFAFLWKSHSRILRTSHLKARGAINRFPLRPGVVSQAAITWCRR